MAFLSRYIVPALLALSLTTGGSAYLLFQKNATLTDALKSEKATSEGLRIARKKDATAMQRFIETSTAEKDFLASQLQTLSEITDAPSREYLDSPVPSSVRRLFNTN